MYSAFHTYILFPLILKLIVKGKQVNSILYSDFDLPNVTIIIAAHNEEKVIKQKIESTFNTSYPNDKIEILIGSDNSNDTTNAIINKYQLENSNLHLIEYKKRQGKSYIINDLVKKSKAEILIFTDANVFFEPTTIYELVKHYKNDRVGQVGGNIINTNIKKSGISYQEKNYLDWEKEIKNNEGLIWGTMIGAFGGCYSIRKSLYKNVPQVYLMDDFYISMNVLEMNKKAIFETKAICYEDVSDKITEEFRRKIRISAGNYQNLFTYKHLLFKPNFGLIFSFFSHKILRWKTPFFIIIALILSFILGKDIELYRNLFLFQVGIFVILPLDLILRKLKVYFKPFRFITHFISMNTALLIGFFKFIFGIKKSVWKPTERNQ